MIANVSRLVPLDELSLSRRVAARIRSEIALHGMQQVEVAQALGLSQQAISLKLHDKRPLSLDEIEALAELFGLEPAELLRLPGRPRPGDPGGAGWAPRGSNSQPAD